MAHTTTLRAHGAACASDARLRRPCSSRASRYFISPACPPAIQRGKDSSSGEFSTGAMPTSSKPASLAACVTLVVISADRSTAAPNKSDSSRTITAKPVPIWNSNLELRFTFKLRNHSPALDQRISFSSQSHATLKLRVLRICFPGDKLYAANHPHTNPHHPNLSHQREHCAGRRGCHAGRRGPAEAGHQRLPPGLGHGRRTHHRPQGHATIQRKLVARSA